MKIYLLDLGSLVIDRSDVLWHIDVGTPVRFPVYGVYIDHPEGKFIFDTGYDLDHVNKVLPFELPEQTPEQTLPAQLAKIGVKPERRSTTSSTPTSTSTTWAATSTSPTPRS